MVLGRKRPRGCVAAVCKLAAALVALLAPAAAGAEVRSGSTTDPVEGDRVKPGEDIVAFSASYDTGGVLSAAVTTAGPPPASEPLTLAVGFGTLLGGKCFPPFAFLESDYGQPSGEWGFEGASGPAAKALVGGTTTLSASAPVLAGEPFDCAEPVIYELVDGKVKPVEGIAAPVVLSAPPAPAPEPPPAPEPARPAPPKMAKLALTPPGPLTLRRGKWKRVKVTVSNPGTAAATRVTLRLGQARGVAVKPSSRALKLKSIAAGKTKTASFELRLTKRAKATSTLKLTAAGAKRLKASATLKLEAWRKPRGGKGGKGRSPLAGKIFYAYTEPGTESAQLIGYVFVDDTWAYNGIPHGGLPRCTRVTATATKEGCVKYSYDPKTRKLRVGKKRGKLTARGALKIDRQAYEPTYIPPAGSRYQVEQEYVGYYGLCGLITGCSIWREHLLLTRGGEFVLSRESVHSVGGSGGAPFVAAGDFPPDQHGTYTIEPRARIKLRFADGSVQTKTIAILLNEAGRPDPVNEGLLLDSSYFIFLPDD